MLRDSTSCCRTYASRGSTSCCRPETSRESTGCYRTADSCPEVAQDAVGKKHSDAAQSAVEKTCVEAAHNAEGQTRPEIAQRRFCRTGKYGGRTVCSISDTSKRQHSPLCRTGTSRGSTVCCVEQAGSEADDLLFWVTNLRQLILGWNAGWELKSGYSSAGKRATLRRTLHLKITLLDNT
jgi:hypothetical protein